LRKSHDFALGPAAVVLSGRAFQVRAVAAVRGDDERDVRIAGDFGSAEWRVGHERIISGGDDQRRNANASDDAQRAGAMIVVGRVAEAVMRRGIRLVECAHGPDAAQRLERERTGDRGGLPPHPRLEVPHEIPLIDDVRSPLERVDAARQVHRRGDGAYRRQLRRGGLAELARELQRKVAAE